MHYLCVMATESKHSSGRRMEWTNSWLTSRLAVLRASSGRKNSSWAREAGLVSVVLNGSASGYMYTHTWFMSVLAANMSLGPGDTCGARVDSRWVLLIWAPRGSRSTQEDIAVGTKLSSGTCFSGSLQREMQSILCVDNFYICGVNWWQMENTGKPAMIKSILDDRAESYS